MLAFGGRDPGFGPGGGVVGRSWNGAGGAWRGTSAVVAVLGLGAAGGCGCESDFRLLQGEIESCFEAEWRCCQQVSERDPEAGMACFTELRERRRRLSEMLFEWLEACRNSERDVARDIGRAIRGVLLGAGCAADPVRTLSDGRIVTSGLPFGPDDAISLQWELPVPRTGGRSEARLSGRSVPIRIGGHDGAVFAAGRMAISVDPSSRIGTRLDAFELELSVGSGPDGGPSSPRVRLRLVPDDRFPATTLERGGTERLGFLVEVVDGREPWPLPRRLWMEWPVRRQGNLILVGGDSMRLWDVIPPDPGIADWNDDGRVDAADLAAFLSAPDVRRDLDLDGTATEKDLDRFLESWTIRCERPSR
jgi:hypothetical protein